MTLETTAADGSVERQLLRWDEEGRGEVEREVRPVLDGSLNDPEFPDPEPGDSQVWASAVELVLTLASDSSAKALAQAGWDESPRAAQLLDEKQLTTFRMRVPLAEF